MRIKSEQIQYEQKWKDEDKESEEYRSEYEHLGRIAFPRKYPDFEPRLTYPEHLNSESLFAFLNKHLNSESLFAFLNKHLLTVNERW